MGHKKQNIPTSLPAVPTYLTVYTRVVLPAEAVAEGLDEAVRLQTATLAPFDEEDSAIGYEVLSADEHDTSLFVAEASIQALEEPYHAQLKAGEGVGKQRLELTALGWIRGACTLCPALAQGTHLMLLQAPSEILIALLEHGKPRLLRSLPGDATAEACQGELIYILTQSAMQPDLGDITETYALSTTAAFGESFKALLGEAPQWVRVEDPEALLQQGLAARAAATEATFDLTPTVWLEAAKSARLARILFTAAGIFAVLWALAALALFLLPRIYAQMASNTTKLLNAQNRSYNAVIDLRERVELIERYNDRSQSVLEMLRLLCVVKPASMQFTSINYRQKQQIRLSGNTDTPADVYAYKEAIQKDPRIAEVKITRLVQENKTRKQRFDIDITCAAEEQE